MASPPPSSVCCVKTAFVAFLGLGLVLLNSAELVEGQSILCPNGCSCLGELVDCSQQRLTEIPGPIHPWVTILHLQGNKITTIPDNAFDGLINLNELILSNNQLSGEVNISSFRGLRALLELSLARNRLTTVPVLGPDNGNLTRLVLSNNQISKIPPGAFDDLPQLRVLDLSFNKIREIPTDAFSWPNSLHHLILSNNRIGQILPGSLDNLTALNSLKLGKNRITAIPLNLFSETRRLTTLDLSRNRLRVIQSLVFTNLYDLQSLILNRNRITTLEDGAFWGLENLHRLELDYNEIGGISKGWLYGLDSLRSLQVTHNKVNTSDPAGWKFCKLLETLDLSYNELSSLELESFSWLTNLADLSLNHNVIGSIADSAFHGLSALKMLDLSNNDISWTIEDMTGAFEGLESLTQLNLAHNQIKSIARKAFMGLETLELLDLRQNFITSIQNNAFSNMEGLTELLLNSSSMLCDCQLMWFPDWVAQAGHSASIQAECAHPDVLSGQSIFDVESTDFTCDDHPQPFIVKQPDTVVALRGDNVSMICTAASSSDSPVQFAWKKDNKVMSNLKMHNFESQGEDNTREFTTVLQLTNIQDEDQGRYQCVIRNHFGSIYSKKAKVTVHVFPSFLLTPSDVEIKVGEDAILECAAHGHPLPEIAWQKDGGENFPAALERRFRVMEESEVFYIVEIKLEDMGIYSCTATNEAGTIVANATLTVMDSPRFAKPMASVESRIGETTILECKIVGSPKPKIRWFKDDKDIASSDDVLFVEDGSMLILSSTKQEDSGTYTCEGVNTLGVTRDSARLIIRGNLPGKMTTSIIIIAVIGCVAGTSLIWVLVIYHTRKRPNRVQYRTASAGLPDDPSLPPEIPSSAFNGSSDGTIHQETSSGVSSAATDKYHGDNVSDCDSLDLPTEQVMFTFPSRGVRTAAIFPSETDMDVIQRDGVCITADVDDDGPDDMLNSSDHLYPDHIDQMDEMDDYHSDMELPPQRPGHESSDNAIVKHPYPREARSYDALDGAPPGSGGCHYPLPSQCHSQSLGRIRTSPGCAKISKDNPHTSATYPRQSPSSRRCRTPEPQHLAPTHLPHHHQQNGNLVHPQNRSNHSIHSNYISPSSICSHYHHPSNHNHHAVNIYENPTVQKKLPSSRKKCRKEKCSIPPTMTSPPLSSTQITELCQERAPSLQPNSTPRIPPSTV